MEKLKSTSGILDLAIIGGGPAGTAAALEARRLGLQVAVWDRDHFPRDKVCGEFISPEALPLLQAEIPETAARGAIIRCAEFVYDNGLARAFQLPHAALGLSRRALDAALWRAAETAGIEAHESEGIRKVRRLAPGSRQKQLWELESGTGTVRRTKHLIVAAGRWWTLEGLSSPARPAGGSKAGEWVGAKAHFAGIPPRSNVEMYFFHGGYCGMAPVEDGGYNVCCLLHRRRVRECGAREHEDFAAWLIELSRHAALKVRLRDAAQTSPVVTTAPVRLARGQPVQDGALLVGDASGFLDPFTGEGISMALHSGSLAARAIATSLSEGLSGEKLAALYRESLSQAVSRSYKVAAIARGLIQGPGWAQGLVAAPLPWLGKHLLQETRWRGSRETEFSQAVRN